MTPFLWRERMLFIGYPAIQWGAGVVEVGLVSP